jgi:hypothetical protein
MPVHLSRICEATCVSTIQTHPSFVSWNTELSLNQKNDGIMVTSSSRLDLVTPLTLNAICTAKLCGAEKLGENHPLIR